MVKSKGGRELNPADAFRKEQRRKEVNRNKMERKFVREAHGNLDTPEEIKKELQELIDAEEAAPLNKQLKLRKKVLQEAYEKAVRKRAEDDLRAKEEAQREREAQQAGPSAGRGPGLDAMDPELRRSAVAGLIVRQRAGLPSSSAPAAALPAPPLSSSGPPKLPPPPGPPPPQSPLVPPGFAVIGMPGVLPPPAGPPPPLDPAAAAGPGPSSSGILPPPPGPPPSMGLAPPMLPLHGMRLAPPPGPPPGHMMMPPPLAPPPGPPPVGAVFRPPGPPPPASPLQSSAPPPLAAAPPPLSSSGPKPAATITGASTVVKRPLAQNDKVLTSMVPASVMVRRDTAADARPKPKPAARAPEGFGLVPAAKPAAPAAPPSAGAAAGATSVDAKYLEFMKTMEELGALT